MKTTNLPTHISKYLTQYSKLSAIFLLLKSGDVASEVVYTDIESDTILAFDDDEFYLDVNDDGEFDFRFLNLSNFFGGYWTSGSIYYIPLVLRQRLQARPLDYNSIAGSVVFSSTYSSGTIQRVFPYALNAEFINFSMNFHPAYYQDLVFRNVTYAFGPFSYYGGNWYPDQLDHFIGIRFKDTDEILHYGWIRCDVKDEGRTLIIKDYAYETESNYPIIAGDTVSYVGVDNMENTIDATAYSFGKDINILTETFQNTELIIYNVNGEELTRNYLQSEKAIISMNNYPSGIYIVTLLNGGKRYAKKVFIG